MTNEVTMFVPHTVLFLHCALQGDQLTVLQVKELFFKLMRIASLLPGIISGDLIHSFEALTPLNPITFSRIVWSTLPSFIIVSCFILFYFISSTALSSYFIWYYFLLPIYHFWLNSSPLKSFIQPHNWHWLSLHF